MAVNRIRMDRTELIVMAAFARLHALALAVAVGCVAGLALWGGTAFLLLRGAPHGYAVGTHLALMSNYLPGYVVSWPGSFIGLIYGFIAGALLGLVVAAVWNLSHFIYLMLIAQRRSVSADL